MNRPIRLANTFHEMAGPFLADLGFRLENDPSQLEQYMATRAVYRTGNGFFLAVGFNPVDGGNAGMICGRSWNYTSDIPELRKFERLSNRYHVLAARFGLDVPEFYKLDVDDEDNNDIQLILDDLTATLSTILERVTLADLIAVEQEKLGSQWHQEREQDHYKSSSIRFAGITPFEEKQRAD